MVDLGCVQIPQEYNRSNYVSVSRLNKMVSNRKQIVAAYAAAIPVTFTRASLLAFRRQASSTLSIDVIARVRLLCLRRHRGRRAGRHVGCSTWAGRPAAVLRPVGNGAYIIARSRSPPTTRRLLVVP